MIDSVVSFISYSLLHLGVGFPKQSSVVVHMSLVLRHGQHTVAANQLLTSETVPLHAFIRMPWTALLKQVWFPLHVVQGGQNMSVKPLVTTTRVLGCAVRTKIHLDVK